MLPRRDFMGLLLGSLGAHTLRASDKVPSKTSSAEVRGVWIHPEGSFDADPVKGKKQIRAAVRRLADAHFNLILPWTLDGYLVALEHPEYLSSHPQARWDALGFLIEEASRVGLDTELWYAFAEYRSRKSPDFDPRVGGNLEWAARRLGELVPDPKTGKVAPRQYENVCPQHPQARLWQLGLLRKAFQRYSQLKGMHVEEPGYRYTDECVCDLCLEVFPKLSGKPLPRSIHTLEGINFRCIGATAFMTQLYEILQQDYPKYTFSTNGAYDWRVDRDRARDWTYWAGMGWLDYYAPQIYVGDVATFRKRLRFTMKTLGGHALTYAGIGVSWSSGHNTVPTVIGQIEASREMNTGGTILFLGDGDVVSDELYRALLRGPFRLPASSSRRHPDNPVTQSA
jgi:uncharacterized lipoprotein YddW (UPF0748 family)